MGLFTRGSTVNQRTNEFAQLAGISRNQAKRTIADMAKMQRTGASEVMVIGAATMRKVDAEPRIDLEVLYTYVDDLVFKTDKLTFSDGTPFNQGIVSSQEVRKIATSAIRLYRSEYVELVRQRMADAS